MKNKAGKEIQKLSFSFILTITPKNISRASPRDEIIKIGLNINPTIKPVAPIISRTIVKRPSFSNPNRLNSFFMCGEMKQDKAYPKKDMLDIRMDILNMSIYDSN